VNWSNIVADADIAKSLINISPLAWNLVYQYPVQTITTDFQPEDLKPGHHFILAYRDKSDEVFLQKIDMLTHLLIETIKENNNFTGLQVVEAIAKQQESEQDKFIETGLTILKELQQNNVIFTKRTTL
jgi:hypothetical protein